MQAVVTVIGSYNSAPAFEYEIQDSNGNVLAVDFVFIHPQAVETWDDLAKFIKEQFLTFRIQQLRLSSTEDNYLEKKFGGLRLEQTKMGSNKPPRIKGKLPNTNHLVKVDNGD